MGCASSKHLESVMKGGGLKRYSKSLSRSRNKNKNKNGRIDEHHHHHVALTSSTYGILNPQTFESEQQQQKAAERGKSFDSSTNIFYEKLKNLESESESGPAPWCEVSKVLDNLKDGRVSVGGKINSVDSNTITFHTVEEVDAKTGNVGSRKNIPFKSQKLSEDDRNAERRNNESDEVTGNAITEFADMNDKPGPPYSVTVIEAKKNPLDGFEEKCPPGGEKAVVIYTTSLRGIRKTFDDCNKVRSVLESFGAPIDERDVSMHLEFRNELRELMGKPVPVPRLFINGRDIGGVEEVLQFNDDGKLDEFLSGTGLPMGTAGKVCDGCGGMRFVPCLECSGSCKLIGDGCLPVRCPHCNENGLIQCPICC